MCVCVCVCVCVHILLHVCSTHLRQEAGEEGADVGVAMVTVGVEGGHQFPSLLACQDVRE